jgi:hypothetical protein
MPKPAPIIKLVGLSISGIPGGAILVSDEYKFVICKYTGTALWTKVSQDSDRLFPLLDGTALDSFDEFVFRVERASFPCKSEPLLACNFSNSTSRGKVAF